MEYAGLPRFSFGLRCVHYHVRSRSVSDFGLMVYGNLAAFVDSSIAVSRQ